jgi:hypothetical protein
MADCEIIKECIFFHDKMEKKYPAATEGLKKRYCRGDSRGCARYVVYKALGKKSVPVNLLPGEVKRARIIVENAGG